MYSLCSLHAVPPARPTKPTNKANTHREKHHTQSTSCVCSVRASASVTYLTFRLHSHDEDVQGAKASMPLARFAFGTVREHITDSLTLLLTGSFACTVVPSGKRKRYQKKQLISCDSLNMHSKRTVYVYM